MSRRHEAGVGTTLEARENLELVPAGLTRCSAPAPSSGCEKEKERGGVRSLSLSPSQLAAGGGRTAPSPVQVGVHVVVALELGQVDQNSGGAAAVSGPAEAAVADASAGRTQPLLPGGGTGGHGHRDTHQSGLTNNTTTTAGVHRTGPGGWRWGVCLTGFSRASRTSSP